ncbi:hypothetical protein PR048_001104 [Dryococelus australis]|uniref:Uncharacterized protein n=1 Tax=Dryococelus australis TaxID=614101 RepID=A0ABQ9IGI2_9NEOP|nr:hypothetical protein PR048_001104 [Dryococelus australis]
MNCCVLHKTIIHELLMVEAETANWNTSSSIQLADPGVHLPSKIDALLGAEVFINLLCNGQIKPAGHAPVASGRVTSSPNAITLNTFSIKRNDPKHYTVKLPLKNDVTMLSNLRMKAHMLLQQLHKNMTTKLQLVFETSAKTSTELSLNDLLLVRPIIQQDLFLICIHRIAMTIGVAKIYRQILIHPSQADLHRVLWSDNPNSEIKTYRFKIVTYGMATAPFLVIRTLHQLTSDE